MSVNYGAEFALRMAPQMKDERPVGKGCAVCLISCGEGTWGRGVSLIDQQDAKLAVC